MNNSRRIKQYKIFPFLIMFLIVINIFLRAFSDKIIWINLIQAGFLISPFWFLLNDIIAEVYGYKISIKLYFYAYICTNIFIGIYYFLIHYFSIKQMAFYYILGDTFNQFVINPIAYFTAFLINSYLLTKWKILLKGRYFWLRSLGSSGIAELLYPILLIPKIYSYYNANQIFLLIVYATSIRLFFTAIFAYPASIIVDFLKIIEKTNDFSNQPDFNPFKPPLNNEEKP